MFFFSYNTKEAFHLFWKRQKHILNCMKIKSNRWGCKPSERIILTFENNFHKNTLSRKWLLIFVNKTMKLSRSQSDPSVLLEGCLCKIKGAGQSYPPISCIVLSSTFLTSCPFSSTLDSFDKLVFFESYPIWLVILHQVSFTK